MCRLMCDFNVSVSYSILKDALKDLRSHQECGCHNVGDTNEHIISQCEKSKSNSELLTKKEHRTQQDVFDENH